MTLQQQISLKRNKLRIGSEETVLITDLDPASGKALGRSVREVPEEDGEILLSCGSVQPSVGDFVPARITNAGPYDLMGELL